MAKDEEPKTSRQERGTQVARAMVLDAAATVLARRGPYGVTIEEIARESGYSAAAIYKYFSSKEDVLLHLWTRTLDELREIFQSANELELAFPLRLQLLVSRIGHLLEQKPEALLAYVIQRPHVCPGDAQGAEALVSEHYEQYHDQALALMRKGIDEGYLRAVDAEDLALLLFGLLFMFTSRWIGTRDEPAQKQVERIIDLFLQGAADPRRPA